MALFSDHDGHRPRFDPIVARAPSSPESNPKPNAQVVEAEPGRIVHTRSLKEHVRLVRPDHAPSARMEPDHRAPIKRLRQTHANASFESTLMIVAISSPLAVLSAPRDGKARGFVVLPVWIEAPDPWSCRLPACGPVPSPWALGHHLCHVVTHANAASRPAKQTRAFSGCT